MAYHMKGYFLICLLTVCIRSTEAQNVDRDTLAKIIRFFNQNYQVNGRQYAAAINVPQRMCQSNFIPSIHNFLINDNKRNVKNAISRNERPIYRGTDLIAAGLQEIPTTAHSEFLLLNPVNNSPLTYLLNQRNDGCVVFYTLNSPCMKTCLRGAYNITPGVDELRNYNGVKVFVFRKIWKPDQGREQDLRRHLENIAQRVPLFRCMTNSECILCGEPSDFTIREQCLSA